MPKIKQNSAFQLAQCVRDVTHSTHPLPPMAQYIRDVRGRLLTSLKMRVSIGWVSQL